MKEENKILRPRIPGEIHTKPHERKWLLKFGKAIEELIGIVTPATFYRWVRDEGKGKSKPKNPKGEERTAKRSHVGGLVKSIERKAA